MGNAMTLEIEGKPDITTLTLTPGEPAGIGPDLCVRIAQASWPHRIVAIADPAMLENRARHLNLPLHLRAFEPDGPSLPSTAGELTIVPVQLRSPVTPGVLHSDNGEYVLETLREAIRGCLQGIFHALITGPVHKGIINKAGIPFSGHTEFIAQLTGGYPVMMLTSPGLRVALATTHLPLAQVSQALTATRLDCVLRVLDQDLRKRFRISQPRVLVCGLNPHAGEGGYLGREEIEVMEPVLQRLRDEGLHLVGPLPADTLFTPQRLAKADAVLAMYHDQGLPVLKYMGFGQAVNVTLGLPIVRTSVDHGTACDLAGTGRADPGSLRAALNLAAQLCGTTATLQRPSLHD